MGIRTVMITGDNPLTAKAIADEAGVDDFLAEATPEDKMALIRQEQAGGKLVAMTGDGTNDAPALAQADVGVAMNTGTSAAKEAGNMVDLDSNPTKLIEIVEIGKQLLITRGALTTFSIANDVAKYFAIIPAMFAAVLPGLDKLNIMGLHSPQSAIASAIIFNALIIVALIPLALRGVRYRPSSAAAHAAPQPVDLRRRRPDRPVRRHQAHRPDHPVHPRIQVIPHEPSPCTRAPAHRRAARAAGLHGADCGIVYPLVMFGVAQVAFHDQANGSLVSYNGKVVGSSLLVPGVRGRQGQPAAAVLPAPAVRRGERGVKTDYGCDPLVLGGIEPRAEQPDADQAREAAQRRGRRSSTACSPASVPPDAVTALRLRPGPGHLPAVRRPSRSTGSPRRGTSARRPCRPWSPTTTRAARSGSSASRASTCSP